MKRFILILLALLSLSSTAAVELVTYINEIYHKGSRELAGGIWFHVTTDDFEDASENEPVYIRITPENNSLLAATLVEQNGSDPDLQSPIYLPMKLKTLDPLVEINAPLDTVSIVRWVKGESSFWIRVQRSSDDWLISEGSPLGPTEQHEVSWAVGLPARLSDYENEQGVAMDQSTLPFSTRDLTAVEGEYEKSVSTTICVDLSNGTLTADGTVDARLNFDIIAYDEEADLGSGFYSGNTGNQNSINFTNDFTIARGRERSCTTLQLQHPNGSNMALTDLKNNMTAASNTYRVGSECESGGDFLTQEILENSYFDLQVPDNAPYGISEADISSMATNTVYENPFMINGQVLYRRARIVFTQLYDESYREMDIDVEVQFDSSTDVTLIPISWTLNLLTHDGPYDEAPYDGEQQWRRCEADLLTTGGGTLDGRACEITRTSVRENAISLFSNCAVTRDIYALNAEGEVVLIAAGVIVDGHTTVPLGPGQFFPDSYYGSVPAGEVPTPADLMAAGIVSVPTLSEWGLMAFITLMLSAGIYIRRR